MSDSILKTIFGRLTLESLPLHEPIVVATFGVAGAILTEAGLSFLGLGVPLAIPSWGGMLAEGRQFADTRYWLALFPGAALFVTVMGINLLGDALRDALDPYLQTRHTRSSVDRL